MKTYEKPMAAVIGRASDVILTSLPTLQSGDTVSVTALKAFRWNS